ncbi:hypothetical protein ACFL2V_22360 [Pseudomonadota bacterium]
MRLTDTLKKQFIAATNLPNQVFEKIIIESRENAISFALRAIQQGHLERDIAGSIIGDAYGYNYMNLDKEVFEMDAVTQLKLDDAISLQVIPVHENQKRIVLATDNPIGLEIHKLPKNIIHRLKVVFTFPDELETAITNQYQLIQKRA